MTDLDVAGLGIWSPFFSDWSAFCTGLHNGDWQTDVPLKPGLIPPRERRRAPQSVKMAKLFKQVVKREMADNTFKPRDRNLSGQSFGRPVNRENEN